MSNKTPTWVDVKGKLGDDPLQPYKTTITHWINPADSRKPLSVAKAKKAISDYKKALGHPEGLAELAVFYCEEVFAFLEICGIDDASFFDALVRMFEQALKTTALLPEERRPELMARLDTVRRLGHNLGYGVGDDMDDLLAEYGFDAGSR